MKNNQVAIVLITGALLGSLGSTLAYAQDNVQVSAAAAPVDEKSTGVEEVKADGPVDEMLEVRTIAKKSDQLLNSLVTISGKKLEAENVKSITDALLLIPGAVPEVGARAVGRVSIDGLAPGWITVMQNGVPIGRVTSNQRGSAYDYGTRAIDPSTIERMEITRGVGPNGQSGIVVNLVTKRKDIVRASVTGRYAQAIPGNGSKRTGFLDTSYRRELMGSLELPFSALFNTNAPILKDMGLNISAGYSNTAPVEFRGRPADEKGPSYLLNNAWIRNFYGDAQLSWNNAGNYLVAGASFDISKDGDYVKPIPKGTRIIGEYEMEEYRLFLNGKWNHSLGYVTSSTSYKSFHRRSEVGKPSPKMDGEYPLEFSAGTFSDFFNQSLEAVFMLGKHDVSVTGSFSGEWTKLTGRNGYLDNELVALTTLGLGERWYINRQWDLELQARGLLYSFETPEPVIKAAKKANRTVDSVSYLPNYDFTVRASWKPNEHYLARLVAGRSVKALTPENFSLYHLDESGDVFIPKDASFAVWGGGEPLGQGEDGKGIVPESMYTVKGEFGLRYKWVAFTYSPFFHYLEDYVKSERKMAAKPAKHPLISSRAAGGPPSGPTGKPPMGPGGRPPMGGGASRPKPQLVVGNRGTGMFFGMNFITEINLPYNINIEGNYTYLPIANLEQEVKKGEKPVLSRVPLRPEHAYHIEVNGRWFDSMFGARFWVDGRGKLPVTAGNITRIGAPSDRDDWIPAVAVINLGVDYSPKKWITIGLEAANLLNEMHPQYGPGAGRYVMATLTLRQEGDHR